MSFRVAISKALTVPSWKSDIAKLLNFPAFRHTNLPEWVGDQDEWTDPKGDQVAAR